MFKVLLHGIKDKIHELELSSDAEKMEALPDEFFGKVRFEGKLIKLVNRYSLTGRAVCKAKLICDRTLKDFTKEISAEISISFLADDNLFFALDDKDIEARKAEDRVIREDDKEVDISEDIAEQLIVSIPMKKLSPEAEDKDLKQIYPDIASDTEKEDQSDEEKDNQEIDERWAPLKNVKLN